MDPTVVKLIFIGGPVVASGLIQLGRWLEGKISEATDREYRRIWTEEIRPKIDWLVSDWPPAGQAMSHFFTAPPEQEYDPRADAAQYIASMWLDTVDFVNRIRQDEY